MKLLGTVRSPFARRVRIALLNLDLKFEWKELSLQSLFPPSAELLTANPLGLVPALQLDDGFNLVDSSEILNYLDSFVAPLWPRKEQLNRLSRRSSVLANGIMSYAVREFQGLRVVSPLDGMVESNIELIRRTLHGLEGDCAQYDLFLLAESTDTEHRWSQSVWDIGIALNYLDFRLADKLNWRDAHPALQQLFQRVSAHPHFLSTVPNL